MRTNVLEYLTEIVERLPDKPAFVGEDCEGRETTLTFRALSAQTDAVGAYLAARGITREPVVVFMEKSPQTVAAFFGVIRAGAFYVPIDAEMPESRIALILENVTPRVMLCDRVTLARAKRWEKEKLCKPEAMPEPVLYDDVAYAALSDTDRERLSLIRARALDVDPIYIVFTSGSTGVPKGVAACHRSVLDYIERLSDTLGFNETTVFANQTPLYFDACLKELYPTCKFGATTYLVPKRLFMLPIDLIRYLNEKKVNTICWVVSALTMLSAFGAFDEETPRYLHTVAFGSEVFPLKQFRIWREVLPNARFTNLYGPTEGTGMCCFYHVEREMQDGEAIPIGRPFPNTEILLLKEDGTPAGEGESGEICIRGTSVTLGYYNNPERTGESFVQNPLQHAYPEIIYKTGDVGRYNEYGELVFLSRKDYQIKHMGHRIELGEIEANVNLLEEIKTSACIYDTLKQKIILFYVGELLPKELTARLKDKLPRYMLPNRVKKLDKMPYTANGKLDRKRLSEEGV